MLSNETQKLLAEGGMPDEGNTVDPVSGNQVPPGAMQEEVRDDIPAQLSEGEFIFPADVVRYIGLETLMKIRDKAKSGLKRMEDIGQMGNANQVENPEALHSAEEDINDEDFSSSIDEIMNEDNPEERNYATGGNVTPIAGFEMVKYKDANGNFMYVPFVKGQPLLKIPTGYTRVSGPEDTTTTKTTTTGGGGSGTTQVDSGGGGGVVKEDSLLRAVVQQALVQVVLLDLLLEQMEKPAQIQAPLLVVLWVV